jgi:hypothetical protein
MENMGASRAGHSAKADNVHFSIVSKVKSGAPRVYDLRLAFALLGDNLIAQTERVSEKARN